jgi:hypothetical protein
MPRGRANLDERQFNQEGDGVEIPPELDRRGEIA